MTTTTTPQRSSDAHSTNPASLDALATAAAEEAESDPLATLLAIHAEPRRDEHGRIVL